LLASAVAIAWFWLRRDEPPEVTFTRARRETLVSLLATNGKAEPGEWAAIRAERAGTIQRLAVKPGDRVNHGHLVAELDPGKLTAELAAAEARIRQEEASLKLYERGGSSAELAEIENGLRKARLDLETSKKEVEALERLVAKQAVTPNELAQQRIRAAQAELQIQSLERRRVALVSPETRVAAQARVDDARAAAGYARKQIALGSVRSSLAGVVYKLELRPGAYVNAGDLIAEVGKLARMKVRVFVDEPELGRAGVGMAVKITWDASPGREWNGVVERMPSQIVALGTRQVGEVICLIENPEETLPPGANVNAEIRSKVVENALTVPRETIYRRSERSGVFLLEGNTLKWKQVELGDSSVARVEVVSGLADGATVALPAASPLVDGMAVKPAIQ